jgi:hypothetical protein
MSLYLKLFNKLKSSGLSNKQLFQLGKNIRLRSNSEKLLRSLFIKQKVLRNFKNYYFKNTIKLTQQLNQTRFISLINWLIKVKLRLFNFLNLSLLKLRRIKNYFTQTQINQMLKRLILIVLIFAWPYCISLKCLQINLGLSDILKMDLQYLRVPFEFATRFVFQLLRNIPGSLEIVNMLASFNDTPLWIIYSYLLIFAITHKELRIPYEIAYNGTVGFLIISLQWLVVFLQEILGIPFDWAYAFMQWFCHRQLYGIRISNINNTNRDIIIRRFRNLYLAQFYVKYHEFKYLISCTATSFVMIASLFLIAYHALYYILTKKYPKIPILTTLVNRTMVNTEGDVL